MVYNNKKGFTLTELIITMAIVAILGTVVVTMLQSGNRFQSGVVNSADLQNNARTAMSYITVKIRQNDTSGGITVDKVNPTDPDYNKLIIKNSDVNNAKWEISLNSSKQLIESYNSSQIVIAEGIQYIKYSMDSTNNILSVAVYYDPNFDPNNKDNSDKILKQDIKLRSDN